MAESPPLQTSAAQPEPFRPGALAVLMLAVALVATAAGVVWLLIAYPQLPETVPTHFNARSEADGWGPRASLLGLGAIWVAVVVGVAVLSRYPQLCNYPVEVTEHNEAALFRVAAQMLGIAALGVSALMWGILTAVITGEGLTWLVVVGVVFLLGGIVVSLVRMMRV